MQPSIWIAIVSCLLGGCFAAFNIALKSFSRSRLSDLLEERGREDRLEAFLAQLPKHQIVTGTLRTCLSLAVLLSTLYWIESQETGLSPLGEYAVAFVIAGTLLSVCVVAIPAAVARHHPESLVAGSMPVIRALTIGAYPLAALLHLFDPMVRRISGADEEEQEGDNSELADEVISVVEDYNQGQPVDEVQKEMLEAVFELPGTTAGEIMTPRTEMKAIPLKSSLDEIKDAVIRFGHSRIPVYDGDLDHIVGILYAKDLIAYVGDGERFELRKILRPAWMVPESKGVRELLSEIKGRKVHIAVVLDEYGGTSGVVTIEDVIEEIVGEIQDEYEPLEQGQQIVTIDDHTLEVDARVEIDDLNDLLDAELPEDEDYGTVGGFVSATLGHIPAAGESFDAAGLRFTVLDAERTKVKRVRVERATAAVESGDGRHAA